MKSEMKQGDEVHQLVHVHDDEGTGKSEVTNQSDLSSATSMAKTTAAAAVTVAESQDTKIRLFFFFTQKSTIQSRLHIDDGCSILHRKQIRCWLRFRSRVNFPRPDNHYLRY